MQRIYTSGFRVLGLVVMLLCTAPAAVKATDGLYGAGAPEDAAFVRIVLAAEEAEVAPVWIGATEFTDIAPFSVPPYRPVSPGIHQIGIGEHTAELIPSRGGYYTVVYDAGGLTIVEDTEHTRPDRAQIVLYNFSALDRLELRTADGETTAVAAVPHGEGRDIAVNPIPIGFTVFSDGEPVKPVGDLGLEGGQSYSVFVFSVHGRLRVVTEQAELDLE